MTTRTVNSIRISKHNQAVLHTDGVSCNPRSGDATTSDDGCEYVELDK